MTRSPRLSFSSASATPGCCHLPCGDETELEDAPMSSLNVRRINCADPGASAELAALRKHLSAQSEVVSPRSRELTVKVFGAPLTPAQVVERICGDVRNRGVDALLHYT